jgi:hypothetical protein
MAQLLTEADLRTFDEPRSLGNLHPSIIRKIESTARAFRAPYIIDYALYDYVYITSDIHADLVKLDMILNNAGLVESNSSRFSDDSAEIITRIIDTKWIPERTLLIIVGDLVDGRRGQPSGEILGSVPDSKGNIELLLHAYLYNMRIKARARNSEIRFTIGNHDFQTVISGDPGPYYDLYVHERARTFFRTAANRAACLMPFYNCCPYVFLAIGDEVACVHGGLMSEKYRDLTPEIIATQRDLDKTGNFDALSASAMRNLASPDGALWTRAYPSGPKAEICSTIDDKYKLVVVGHCQMATGNDQRGYNSTGEAGRYSGAILRTDPYTKYGCGGLNGCVVMGCTKSDGPHLAMVDIGLSRAFNPIEQTYKEEQQRRTEILFLRHDSTGSDSRYYNIIVRKNAAKGGDGDEYVPLDDSATVAAHAAIAAKYGPNYEIREVKLNKDGDWIAKVCSLLNATCVVEIFPGGLGKN